MDEQELQELWDKGSAKKVGSKVLTSAASQPANAKVKPIGPSQQILAPSKSSSTRKGSLGKRKRASSPDQSTPKPRVPSITPVDKKLSSSCWESTNTNVCSMDNSEDGSSGKAGLATDDKDNSNLDMGNGDGNGNGNDGRDKSKSLVSSGMFIPPCKYKALVSKSWACAAAEYGVDTDGTKYKLQKRHKQAIHACINSFWSWVCDRLKPAIASMYKLLAEGHTPNEAKEYIQSLFLHAYHTKVGTPPGTRHFQHSFLEEAIFKLYYTRNNPVGIAYEKWFNPMPLEAIGFVCAVVNIQCIYREWAGCSVLKEQPKLAKTTLQEDNFAKDIPTAEELKFLVQGLLHGHTAPKNAGNCLKNLAPSPTNWSNTAQSQTTSQPSSLPLPSSPDRANAADGANLRERSSSVSLDHKESKDKRKTTPTLAVQTCIATEDKEDKEEKSKGSKVDKKDGEDKEDKAGKDKNHNNANSTSNLTNKTKNKVSSSQKPPKTKRKNDNTDNKVSSQQQPLQKRRKNKTQSTSQQKLTESSRKLQNSIPKLPVCRGS
ncbi:hypothetical protein RHS01_08599 [Rhizoctonia solani]|uniref:DUF6532 domain-containing protein n=1 Tax=Rhizoctonia solani TaxID=456999 RepID=A0A8H7I6R9_9AGAM|nr:hypothetical protein RHS01_08599 [Rhizoctonia solani]